MKGRTFDDKKGIMMDLVGELTGYIKKKYGVDPEHPWMRYPDNMTFKEKTADKWFALVMPVAKRKLGLADDGEIYVVNVKSDPEFIGMISRTEGYMPGYHMNKQHWLTVFLDGTVPLNQIFDRVDESFNLVTDSPSKRIYEAVRKIPKGKVATYGQVAELAGNKKMARAVGNALHRNPDPDSIPCYRVVNAKGELAGEFAFGGAGEQAKLLMADGIEVVDGKVDLEKYGMKIIQNH
jgi:O-6-methylguanine DNA methyltransferase